MTKQTTDKNDQKNHRDHHRSLESVMAFTASQLYEVQERMRPGHSASKQNLHKEPLEIPEAALNWFTHQKGMPTVILEDKFIKEVFVSEIRR